MKVVLFCGGLGTRLREHSDTIPKPLVNIGYRPIIWHLMKYYAHFGHKEFILCLGYRGDQIREYFLNYDDCLSSDFTLSFSGERIQLLGPDIHDWKITFVDTGLHANIGERLLAVKPLLDDEEYFLANYSDGLSDIPLDQLINGFQIGNCVASFACVRTSQSFHSVHTDNDGFVTKLGPIADSEFWINGGFFVFRKEIFNYVEPGEDLVEEPFQRLISEKRLLSTKYLGFWQSMDTLKDKISFDRMYARGNAPWELWHKKSQRQ